MWSTHEKRKRTFSASSTWWIALTALRAVALSFNTNLAVRNGVKILLLCTQRHEFLAVIVL
jgi:hypothetical protein